MYKFYLSSWVYINLFLLRITTAIIAIIDRSIIDASKCWGDALLAK
jgi:hypothetical protein